MRITVLSKDSSITGPIQQIITDQMPVIEVLNPENDTFDMLAEIFTKRPKILIADDDLLKPDSVKLLKAVRKVVKDVDVVFVTSDASMELGREVSRLGIQSYMLKPIEANVLSESLEHLTKHHKQL